MRREHSELVRKRTRPCELLRDGTNFYLELYFLYNEEHTKVSSSQREEEQEWGFVVGEIRKVYVISWKRLSRTYT